uniref:Uncharacterized protein n=1 Tax=Eptatretus burgeri TaxID=7764 RepID=A0A8C4NIL2_EPTBU
MAEYLDEASIRVQHKLQALHDCFISELAWLDGVVQEAQQTLTTKGTGFLPKTPSKRKRKCTSRISKPCQTRSTRQEVLDNCNIQLNGSNDGGTTQADTSLQDHKMITRLALRSEQVVVNPGTDGEEHASITFNETVAIGERKQASRSKRKRSRAVIQQTRGKQHASPPKKKKQSLAEAEDTAIVAPVISKEKDIACNASHANIPKSDPEHVSESSLIENNKAKVRDVCSTEVQPVFSKDDRVEERVMDWMNNWKVDEIKDRVKSTESNGRTTEQLCGMNGEESGSNGVGGGGAKGECAATVAAGEAECRNVDNITKEAKCSHEGETEKEKVDLRSVEAESDGEESEVLAELEIPKETETVAGLPQVEGSNARLSVCRRSSRLVNRSLAACSSLATRVNVLRIPGQQNLESCVQPSAQGPAVNEFTPPDEPLNVTRSLRKAKVPSVLQRKANYQKALQQSWKSDGKNGGKMKNLPPSKIQESPLFSTNKLVLAITHQRPKGCPSSTPQPVSSTPYSFIKDTRPQRIDPKQREKERVEYLQQKQMLQEERCKRVMAQRKERLQEQKRKQEERSRKAAEARVKLEMLSAQKKRKMELKIQEGESERMQVARELEVLRAKEKCEKLRKEREMQERARVAKEENLKKEHEEERLKREKVKKEKEEQILRQREEENLQKERHERIMKELQASKEEEDMLRKELEAKIKLKKESQQRLRTNLDHEHRMRGDVGKVRNKREEQEQRNKREELEMKKKMEELERKKMEELERKKKMEELERKKKMEELERKKIEELKREELELERKKRKELELERKKREELELERKKREELELERKKGEGWRWKGRRRRSWRRWGGRGRSWSWKGRRGRSWSWKGRRGRSWSWKGRRGRSWSLKRTDEQKSNAEKRLKVC